MDNIENENLAAMPEIAPVTPAVSQDEMVAEPVAQEMVEETVAPEDVIAVPDAFSQTAVVEEGEAAADIEEEQVQEIANMDLVATPIIEADPEEKEVEEEINTAYNDSYNDESDANSYDGDTSLVDRGYSELPVETVENGENIYADSDISIDELQELQNYCEKNGLPFDDVLQYIKENPEIGQLFNVNGQQPRGL